MSVHTLAIKQQPAQPESPTTTTTTNSAYPFTKLFGRKQPSLAPFVHPTLAQDVDVELFFLLLPAFSLGGVGTAGGAGGTLLRIQLFDHFVHVGFGDHAAASSPVRHRRQLVGRIVGDRAT